MPAATSTCWLISPHEVGNWCIVAGLSVLLPLLCFQTVSGGTESQPRNAVSLRAIGPQSWDISSMCIMCVCSCLFSLSM